MGLCLSKFRDSVFHPLLHALRDQQGAGIREGVQYIKSLLNRLIVDFDLVHFLEANLLGDNHMDDLKNFFCYGSDFTSYS